MPFSNRSNDQTDGNRSTTPRRSFRSTISDFKRSPKSGPRGKPAPPDNTSAENFYYLKQMSSKTPMVIVMTDGEEIRGCIEWYDRNCLKVNREGAPNLLIQRHCIKYLFKQEEEV